MNHRHPSTMSDDELIENLKRLIDEERRAAMEALADVYAGRYADPFLLDLLRDHMDDDEVDALMERNDRLQPRSD